MKIVVVLFVLVLTLDIGGAAGQTSTAAEEKKEEETTTAEEKKEEEATCKTDCLARKLEPALCKESCDIFMHFKTVSTKEAECSFKCSDPKPGPATKPCEQGCKKEYDAKVAEITGSCNKLCSKVDKDQAKSEACKKTCTPALILKSLEEAVQQASKKP